jgi:hypothetical protein
MTDLGTATLEGANGEDVWSFRDAFDETLSNAKRGAVVELAAWLLSWPRARQAFRRAWRLVRWKMVAIITLTSSSTLLIACLAVATSHAGGLRFASLRTHLFFSSKVFNLFSE